MLAADYVLFVDKKAVGVIEAKPEDWGHKITTVEYQSRAMLPPNERHAVSGLDAEKTNLSPSTDRVNAQFCVRKEFAETRQF